MSIGTLLASSLISPEATYSGNSSSGEAYAGLEGHSLVTGLGTSGP